MMRGKMQKIKFNQILNQLSNQKILKDDGLGSSQHETTEKNQKTPIPRKRKITCVSWMDSVVD